MESKVYHYAIEQEQDGFKFSYRLGVYAGTIKLIKGATIEKPELINHVFGWECRFPPEYSTNDMIDYLSHCVPYCETCRSHSKDLMIFNEVVNKNNTSLTSIFGMIFVDAK